MFQSLIRAFVYVLFCVAALKGLQSGPFNAVGQNIHLGLLPLADACPLRAQLGLLDAADQDAELYEDGA